MKNLSSLLNISLSLSQFISQGFFLANNITSLFCFSLPPLSVYVFFFHRSLPIQLFCYIIVLFYPQFSPLFPLLSLLSLIYIQFIFSILSSHFFLLILSFHSLLSSRHFLSILSPWIFPLDSILASPFFAHRILVNN